MINRSIRRKPDACLPAAVSLAGVVAFGLLATGCGSEPEEAVVAAPVYTPPPAPEVPQVTPISELMAQLRIDDRVYLPEDRAPDNDPARKAVLEFFDGFARGDANAVRRMVSGLDQRELDAMVASGQWQATVEGIESIEIETDTAFGGGSGGDAESLRAMLANANELRQKIESGEFGEMAKQAGWSDGQLEQMKQLVGTPEWNEHVRRLQDSLAAVPSAATPSLYIGDNCALALFIVDGREQAQLWYYQQRGDEFEFQSAPTPPNMVNRLSGNWIAKWHEIINHEMMLAGMPDERVAPPQRRLDDEPDSPGGGSPGGAPGGPAQPPGPIGPPPPPIEAPSGPEVNK